ncbi:PAS domain S-box protein [Pseudooceanicola sp. CBS1P-1]|uniref:histidine kinase n=1 Tax=Pseudooceanicola albus TaxID=2692189 RepID=A0A6L7G7C1_9RHOB|nr:cache domain-containing protein [Pseudooceanicola endophyticus]MBT9384337.1 PAS domain S-box protein [Pseudooceanicola endophyticus]MXN19925.1 PAS domain S-box protein [Pseudooceanicola albus]
MTKTLGVPLFLGLAGLQLVAVLAIVFSSYVTSEKVLMFHARNLLRNVGFNTMEHSRSFLKPAHDGAELAVRLAQNDIIASDDPVLMEKLLFQQLQLASQVSGMYFGATDGSFVFVMRDGTTGNFRSKIITMTGGQRKVHLIWRDSNFNALHELWDPADDFDPRSRSWYQRARAASGATWADPYIFFSSHEPGITLAAPVQEKGRFSGVVGVDIQIDEISHFMSRLVIGKTGRAIIINQNGDVIAGQNEGLLKAKDASGNLHFYRIDSYGDPIARAAFANLFGPDTGPPAQEVDRHFTYQGRDYVALAMPMSSEDLPWTIGVYAPEDDFISEIKHNRTTNIWIAVAVALCTGLAGLALANRIHRPVRAFAVRSALVAQGEIDPDAPPPRTYRELEAVNAALTQQIRARREAERQYGLTFEMSSRGMAQLDPVSGRFLRVNARLCDIAGRSAEALSRMTLADLVLPADRRILPAGPELPASDFSTNQELRLARPDGTVVWVRLNAISIRDSAGKALHAMLTLEDVTHAHEQESQLTQLSRDMTALVRDNTMSQLANGLAHELNQPLVAIAQNAGTALYLLQQRGDPPGPLQETLVEIEGQALRAGEVINALRALLRPDAGTSAPFRIDSLAGQVLCLIQHEADDAGVALRLDCPGPLAVMGNRVQIAQVLVNLLRNAVEAFAGTDIPERSVSLQLRSLGGRIRIAVQDNGPGVPRNLTLFSQFETSKPEGLGLGLSICRTLVQMNGGLLWHEGPAGGGARFCLTLPAADLPAPDATQTEDTA